MKSSGEYFEELKEIYTIRVNKDIVLQQKHICVPNKTENKEFTDKLFDLQYKQRINIK
jgi:hypothetical protein